MSLECVITLAFIRFGQFQNEMMTYFVVVLFNYFLTFTCAVNSTWILQVDLILLPVIRHTVKIKKIRMRAYSKKTFFFVNHRVKSEKTADHRATSAELRSNKYS